MSGFVPVNKTFPVNYRTFSWEEMVEREWGTQWGIPETAYEFSNGRTAQSNDEQSGSFYKRT